MDVRGALHALSRPALIGLAQALDAGRLSVPVRSPDLARWVPETLVEPVREALGGLLDDGMAPRHVAHLLRAVADERQQSQALTDSVELVWSGPAPARATTRDTAVVVRQLFRRAKRSVLIASFAIDTGDKAEELVGGLATRMDVEPELTVRLYLNVPRLWQDDTPEEALVAAFARRFRDRIWPGERLPEVYYDPRSLAPWGSGERSSLHAKVVVIDDATAFVSSANFTQAAQNRNIEAGVVMDNASFARTVRAQFTGLVAAGALVALPV